MSLIPVGWPSTNYGCPKKPERNAQKRPKDARQGEVLLDACRYFLADAYPLDIDFVLGLTDELRDLFNDWAQRNKFDPTIPAHSGFPPP